MSVGGAADSGSGVAVLLADALGLSGGDGWGQLKSLLESLDVSL